MRFDAASACEKSGIHYALRQTLRPVFSFHNGNFVAHHGDGSGEPLSPQLEEAFHAMDDSPGANN
jgi:hypothetical protein